MVIECNQIFNKYLYRHRRLDNNEIFYVGIGTGNNLKRANNKSTRNNLWKKIVNKTKYNIEIIATNLSFEDAKELEIFLIQLYGRKDLKTGNLSNMTDGGKGALNMSLDRKKKLSNFSKNRIWSNESKKKLSNSKKGVPLSDFHKEQCRKGKLGTKVSKKTRLLMSKNSYRCRKVIDISTNIIYNTLKEVSTLFNIKPSTLSHYLNNTRTNKTTFKYMQYDN
jgi:hypothetical protein